MRRDERKRTGARGVSNYQQETIMKDYFSDEDQDLLTEMWDLFFENIDPEDHEDAAFCVVNHLLRRQAWYGTIHWSRNEAEQMLLERHGLVDKNLWLKVCLSDAVYEFQEKMQSLAEEHLEKAIDEIVATSAHEKPHNS
jgi:hypothetical protein